MYQQKFTIFTNKKINYVIEQAIGEGTGGSVYRAYKLCNNQKYYVALKVQSQLNDMERLTLETLCQYKLNYNINIQDLDYVNNQPIIIMDLADGSFYDFWHQSTMNDVKEILCYFIQIAKGTQELHKLSLIHRDLKLQNVVYQQKNNEKHLKLCDTGLIRQQNGRKTIKVGTPYYMAPEQINQSIYDEKIDIWALGMILFEMLAKQTLVKGNSIEELLNNILRLNQFSINRIIDQLQIQNQQQAYDIKNLLKKMLTIESKNRIKADQVVKDIERMLNVNQILNENHDFFNQPILKPEIKEQLRLEIQKEFQQKHRQEYEKLNEQHILQMEQIKNDIKEHYEKQQIRQKIQIQIETEENLKAKYQIELKLLQEEFNKKIVNCNQQQIEELKYQYEQDKENTQKQMELRYQQMLQQELKQKEDQLQKQMEEQISRIIQNREQNNKILVQEQLQRYYQEEFENKTRILVQFQNRLILVQQNLNKSQMLIDDKLINLNNISQLNQSKYQHYISEYQKELQNMLNQIQLIKKQLSELQQNQQYHQIDANLEKLILIQQNSQKLIQPNLVESFIQNQNTLLEDIRKQQQNSQLRLEKRRLQNLLEDSEKEKSKLQDLFIQQKDQLKEVNAIIDSLNLKDNDLLQQQDVLNQMYNQIDLDFQILCRQINLIKEEELKIEILLKSNQQFVNLVDQLNQFNINVTSFKYKISQQRQKEQQQIENQLQTFIQTINDWEQKNDYLNSQQQVNINEQLQQQFEKLNRELQILLTIRNMIFQLLNEIKQNQNQNFLKQFSDIEQQYQITIFKLQLIENYSQQVKIKSQCKTKEHIQVQEEQKKIIITLNQQIESLSKKINNFENQFQNVQNRFGGDIQFQNFSQQLEIIKNIFNNHIKMAEEIKKCNIEFQKYSFKTINEIKLEETKMITQINQLSQNLHPLFNILNEISNKITESNDIYWEDDLESLINQVKDLKVELDNIKLSEKEEQFYNKLNDSKQNLKNNIEQCLKQCQNDIQQNNLLRKFCDSQYVNQELSEKKIKQQERIYQKKTIFNRWAEDQKIRIKENEKQIENEEKQWRKEIIENFIKDYQKIDTVVNNLKNNLDELKKSQNKPQLNEYQSKALYCQEQINLLKQNKQSNQSCFQNLNFYVVRNQMVNCINVLYKLYCLYGREKFNLEQNQINSTSSANMQSRQQKKDLEQQNILESFNKIQICFNFVEQNEFFKLDKFIESINNYLIFDHKKDELKNERDYESQLQYLHEKLIDKQNQQQIIINEKNKVKINCKFQKSNQLFQSLKTTYGNHLPALEQIFLDLPQAGQIKNQKY